MELSYDIILRALYAEQKVVRRQLARQFFLDIVKQQFGSINRQLWLIMLLSGVVFACGLPQSLTFQSETDVSPVPSPSATFELVPTFTPTPVVSPSPSSTSTPSPTPLPTLPLLATPTVFGIVADTQTAAVTSTVTAEPIEIAPTRDAPRVLSDEELNAVVSQMCPRRQACFMSPMTGLTVTGVVEFRGAANRPGFDFYKLEYQKEGTTDWVLIESHELPVQFASLGYWQTADVQPGKYFVRLIVVDINGNYWDEQPVVELIVEK